jgi:hypothetical protein
VASSETIIERAIHKNTDGKYRSLSVEVVLVLTGKLAATTREQMNTIAIAAKGTRLALRTLTDLT